MSDPCTTATLLPTARGNVTPDRISSMSDDRILSITDARNTQITITIPSLSIMATGKVVSTAKNSDSSPSRGWQMMPDWFRSSNMTEWLATRINRKILDGGLPGAFTFDISMDDCRYLYDLFKQGNIRVPVGGCTQTQFEITILLNYLSRIFNAYETNARNSPGFAFYDRQVHQISQDFAAIWQKNVESNQGPRMEYGKVLLQTVPARDIYLLACKWFFDNHLGLASPEEQCDAQYYMEQYRGPEECLNEVPTKQSHLRLIRLLEQNVKGNRHRFINGTDRFANSCHFFKKIAEQGLALHATDVATNATVSTVL